MSEFQQNHQSAVRAATWRILLFSALLLLVVSVAFWMALDPKTVNETLGFRPLDRDKATLGRLKDNYGLLVPLDSVKPWLVGFIDSVEGQIKSFGFSERTSESDEPTTDGKDTPSKPAFKEYSSGPLEKADADRLFMRDVELVDAYSVSEGRREDENIYGKLGFRATYEVSNRGGVQLVAQFARDIPDSVLDRYELQIVIVLPFPSYPKAKIADLSWPRRSAIPGYLDKMRSLESIDIRRYRIPSSLFLDADDKEKVKKKIFDHLSRSGEDALPYGSGILDGAKEKRYAESFLRALEKDDQERIRRLVFDELTKLHSDVVKLYSEVDSDIESIGGDIDLIFNQISSDRILYASVVAQRVLVGLLLVSAVVYFLRSIFADLNLQRLLTIGRISKLYADGKEIPDKDVFVSMFSLLRGSASDPQDAGSRGKKDSALFERLSKFMLEASFIDRLIARIEKRKKDQQGDGT